MGALNGEVVKASKLPVGGTRFVIKVEQDFSEVELGRFVDGKCLLELLG